MYVYMYIHPSPLLKRPYLSLILLLPIALALTHSLSLLLSCTHSLEYLPLASILRDHVSLSLSLSLTFSYSLSFFLLLSLAHSLSNIYIPPPFTEPCPL